MLCGGLAELVAMEGRHATVFWSRHDPSRRFNTVAEEAGADSVEVGIDKS